MPLSNPASFHAEARWQRVCAVDGTGGEPWAAHHVVPKQLLRRLKLPLYDPRNALRLCEHCHMQFEWGGPGKVLIAVRHLTDQNICYCWETLGDAVVRLERKYTPFHQDPRWVMHRMGECGLCQLSLPTYLTTV
jgi:hypothetical protein